MMTAQAAPRLRLCLPLASSAVQLKVRWVVNRLQPETLVCQQVMPSQATAVSGGSCQVGPHIEQNNAPTAQSLCLQWTPGCHF